jgi:hypothetical protein
MDIIKEISQITNKFIASLNFPKTYFVTNKTPFIHYFQNSTLTQQSIKDNTKKDIYMSNNFTQYCESIECKGRIFITDGNQHMVFEADLQNKTYISKRQMVCQNYYNSLCASGNFIYSTGGGVQPADCEKI